MTSMATMLSHPVMRYVVECLLKLTRFSCNNLKYLLKLGLVICLF